jgi:hypothetical protein
MKNNIKYELNIEDFMKNVIIEDKNFSKYEDSNGTMFILNTVQLLARVDYMELTEKELEQAKFTQSVEKKEYKSKIATRLKSKYEETKKEEDRFTIVDTKIKVYQVWNVSNPYGAYKSFDNKEEALKLANSINNKIKKYID